MPGDARQRTRFHAALALYVGWIAALLVMAVVSAKPPPRAEAKAPTSAGVPADRPGVGR